MSPVPLITPARIGLVLVIATILFTGCSYSYVDHRGTRHVIGLVDVAIEPAGEDSTFAGDIVDITTVGISLIHTEQGGHFGIGYSRDTVAAIRDHSLVLGNPLQVQDRTLAYRQQREK